MMSFGEQLAVGRSASANVRDAYALPGNVAETRLFGEVVRDRRDA